MALRSQVSVGGGRSSDNNKDTNKANTTAQSRQSSAARDTYPHNDKKQTYQLERSFRTATEESAREP